MDAKSLLKQVSNPKLCNDQLSQNIKSFLQKALSGTRKTQGKTITNFCIALLKSHHTLSNDLQSIYTKELESFILDSTVECLNTLDKISADTKPFDIEKLLLNLISKLNGINTNSSIILLSILHKRLKKYAENDTKAVSTNRPITSAYIDKNKESLLLNLLVFPYQNQETDLLILLLTMMNQSLKAYINSWDDYRIQKLEAAIQHPNGVKSFLKRLFDIDEKSAQKQGDISFSLIYKLSLTNGNNTHRHSHDSGLSPSSILKLRSLALELYTFTSNFNIEQYADIAHKTCVIYEKNSGVDGHFKSFILNIHEQFIQNLIVNEKENDLPRKVILFRDYLSNFNLDPRIQEPDSEDQIITQFSSLKIQVNSQSSTNVNSVLREMMNSAKKNGIKGVGDIIFDGDIKTSVDSQTPNLLHQLLDLINRLISNEKSPVDQKTMTCLEFLHQIITIFPTSTKGITSISALMLMVISKCAASAKNDDMDKLFLLSDSLLSKHPYKEGYKWISTTCYNHAGRLLTTKQVESAVPYLKKSIYLLEKYSELSPEEDNTQLLIKRYDILTNSLLNLCSYSDAVLYLKRAIRLAALAGSQELDNILSKYIKASIKSNSEANQQAQMIPVFEFILCDTQIETEPVNLFHKELSVIRSLGIKYNTENYQENLFRCAIQHFESRNKIKSCCEVKYEYIRFMFMRNVDLESLLEICEKIIKDLKNLDDVDVSSVFLVASVYFYQGMICNIVGKPDSSLFTIAVIFVDKIADILLSDKSNSVQIEVFRDQVEMMISYFKNVGYYKKCISVVNILKKIISTLPITSLEKNGLFVRLNVQLAEEYSKAGYTGKAALCYAEAQKLLSKSDAQNQILWKISYIGHLLTLDNMTKSMEIYQEISDLNRHDVVFTQSRIFLQQNDLIRSIIEMKAAIKQIKSELKQIMLSDDDFVKKSSYSQNLLTYYSWIGQLHLLQGSIAECEYFFKQGLNLATKTSASSYIIDFNLKLADLSCRRRYIQTAEKSVSDAEFQMEKICDEFPMRKLAVVRYRKGDVVKVSEDGVQALEVYKTADDLVAQAADTNLINTVPSNFESPGSPKLSKIYKELHDLASHGDSKPAHQPRKTVASKSKQAESLLLDTTGLKYEAKVVSGKSGIIYAENGKIEDAERYLKNAYNPKLKSLETTEHFCTYASVQAQKLLNHLRSHSNGSVIYEDSVIVLPSRFPALIDRKLSKPKMKSMEAIKHSIHQVMDVLNEACESAYTCGHSRMHSRVAKDLLKLYITENLIFGNDQAEDDLNSFVCELERSKSLTLSREIKGKSRHENESTDNLITSLQSFLKSNWIVWSLTYDETDPSLLVTVIQQKSCPVTMRIPLLRNDEEDLNLLYKDAIAELRQILIDSKSTTELKNGDLGRYEKQQWWTRRKEIDNRLRKLLKNIEQKWFGPFKGIFKPNVKFSEEFLQNLEESIQNATKLVLSRKSSCIRHPPLPIPFLSSLARCNSSLTDGEARDAVTFILDVYRMNSVIIEHDEEKFEMFVEKLSDILNELSNEDETHADEDDCHFFMILDESLQEIPFESLSFFKNLSISRVPSVESLTYLLKRFGSQPVRVKLDDGFCVLNPTGDLKHTEEMFKDVVQGIPGHVGTVPPSDFVINNIKEKNLFLYFGHGGCEQYVSRHKLKELEKCAATLLLGCASGRLFAEGSFDLEGTALDYIVAGCPSIMGNLWDVTDKDIDKFTAQVFMKCGLMGDSDEHLSLTKSIAESRSICTLPYLNGAAPVVYGLPLIIDK